MGKGTCIDSCRLYSLCMWIFKDPLLSQKGQIKVYL